MKITLKNKEVIVKEIRSLSKYAKNDVPYLDEAKKELTDGELTNSFTLRDTPVQSDVVPEGHLFVMGDNRRFSKDSRHIGAIPMDKVVGTTKIVFYPIQKIKVIDNK